MKTGKSLRARALDYLSRREMSQAELRRKLSPYAENADELDALMAELAERNWQSDSRYAESYVHSKSSRYGSLRLAQNLSMQGVAAETIAEVLPQRADERQTACGVLRKKFRTPPQELRDQQRAYRFLVYRGFGADDIRHALKHAWDGED